MSWTTPKTNWVATDSFDKTSYNRIAGNVNVLKTMTNKLFPNTTFDDIAENKSYADYVYADEMNAIENTIHKVNDVSFEREIGTKQVFATNQPTPDFKEYNRIENACLILHDEMKYDIDNLPKLKVRLGNVKGVKL